MSHHTAAALASCSRSPQQVDPLTLNVKVLLLIASVVMFAAVFAASWWYLHRQTRFLKKPHVMRADLCSRVYGTFHSLVIVPGLLYGLLTTTWSEDYAPLTSVGWMQAFLLVSVGYFVFDLAITVYYRLPQWPVYAVHHVAACVPYAIYLFVPPCTVGLFVLAAFLLVETTNVTLNIQAFLEQFGYGNSKAYVGTLYSTLGLWVVVRIANPLYLLYVIHTRVWPAACEKSCLAFSLVCAYAIALFCIGCFFHVLLPEAVNRWRAYPAVRDVAGEPRDSTVLKINPDLPMSPDEYELTVQSPTRIVLYEAREKALELENAVNRSFDLSHRHGPPPTPTESTRLRRRSNSQPEF